MSTKHTPGPWNEDGVFVCDDEDNIICEMYEINADARLIAAAPELLEALDIIYMRLEAYNDADRDMPIDSVFVCLETARAAIKKATGEEA